MPDLLRSSPLIDWYSNTAWWRRHMCVNNLPGVALNSAVAGIWTCDLYWSVVQHRKHSATERQTPSCARSWWFSAPSIWNSLPQTVLISDSLSVFKSRLKFFLFNQAYSEHWSDLLPAHLKLWQYGAIESWLLLLLCIDYLQCFDTVGWATGRASGL